MSDEGARYFDTLDRAVAAASGSGVPFLVAGSVASAVFGDWPWEPEGSDVDFFLREADAQPALRALEADGFAAKESGHDWLLKAELNDITVDLIFEVEGMAIDDDMIERTVHREFEGRDLPFLSPEDQVATKVVAFGEETDTYWYEALRVLARNEMDWEYLLGRAKHSPSRFLSLAVYARGEGIDVPDGVVARLAGLAGFGLPG